MSTWRERKDDIITCRCMTCGSSIKMPDKGLGRANIAVFESIHQNCMRADDGKAGDDA